MYICIILTSWGWDWWCHGLVFGLVFSCFILVSVPWCFVVTSCMCAFPALFCVHLCFTCSLALVYSSLSFSLFLCQFISFSLVPWPWSLSCCLCPQVIMVCTWFSYLLTYHSCFAFVTYSFGLGFMDSSFSVLKCFFCVCFQPACYRCVCI